MQNTLITTLKQLNIITERGQINKQAKRLLTNRYPDILEQLYAHTDFLLYDADIRDRIFCVMNDIQEQPRCETCGQIMKFNKAKNRFNQFCVNTKLNSCSMKNKQVVGKIKNTMISRYGVDAPLKNTNILQKQQKTMLQKYGVKSIIQLPEYVDQLKQHHKENQDVIQDKRKTTMIERYNREHYAQCNIPNEAYKILQDKTKLQDMLKDLSKTEIALSLGVSFNLVHAACKRLGIKYIPIKKPGSVQQQAIEKFIMQNYDGGIIFDAKNVIPNYDIDIYIPELNLAFEFNGVYFHGETKNRDKKYHLNKHVLCEIAGIQLFQIWSNEWLNKKDIVCSRVLNALGKSQRLYARQCEVEKISASTERGFFDSTHIQGYVPSTISYSLKYDNRIVAVMSFIRSRFNKQYQWELLRYSCDIGTTIVGGPSKLFKAFVKEYAPDSVVSYCDIRWGTGNMYSKLGFKHIQRSNPNYFYFNINGDTNVLFSRIQFQKHKLKDKFENFDPALTEWANMKNNNYDRIWDCGNDVWAWSVD